jgi:serine/threonine-protein kinase
MADVYRAEAPGLAGFRKEVAIKVIRPGFGGRSEFVRMFINEAQLASRLNHANIVQVFDFDQVEGQYYIAMEFVRGRTLLEIMDACRERGLWLDLPQSLHICAQVASALSYAHRLTDAGRPLSLVHRDVSPQNVLVSFEGEVKLADFGIAYAMGASGMTAPGIVKGKLAYMAPEQARAERVDPRADVFALGVVAWELCTGNDLFARDSDAASLAAVLGPQPVIAPPSNWNPKVSPELDLAIMAALERDRERRTGSAEELATQLSEVLLKVVRSSAETDLRKLMRRLWPEGSDNVIPPIAPLQPTEEFAPKGRPGTPAPAEASPRAAPTTLVLHDSRLGPAVSGGTKRLPGSPSDKPSGEKERKAEAPPGRTWHAKWIAVPAVLAVIAVAIWMVGALRGRGPVKDRPAAEAQQREAARAAAPVQLVPVATVQLREPARSETAAVLPAVTAQVAVGSGRDDGRPVVQPARVAVGEVPRAGSASKVGSEKGPTAKPPRENRTAALGERASAKATRRKDAADSWVAFLDVHVPAGAVVYLNGRLLGDGENLRSSHLKVTPGSHHLLVKMDESQAEEDVIIQPGQTYRFQLTPK